METPERTSDFSGGEDPDSDTESALKELFEGAKQWSLESSPISRQDVEELREWCAQHKYIPHAPDYLLAAFLHSCSGDADLIHSAVSIYHTIRQSAPEVFTNRSFHQEGVQKAKALGYFCILPNKTPEGYRIILQALRNPDPTDFVYANCCKTQFLAIDSCIRADPTTKGYIFINDMKGATMTHMWKWGFRLPRKIFSYLQGGMPLRMQRIHFVNTTPLMDKMMKMVRPLIRKEAMSMLHLHTPDDMDYFFSMIPRYCMPREYGGTLPALETLQDQTDWFLERMCGLVS